jgi:hypothetical protein
MDDRAGVMEKIVPLRASPLLCSPHAEIRGNFRPDWT